MGRAVLIIKGEQERQKATHWVSKAPLGTRIEFRSSNRSLPQNDLLWARLTEIATSVVWYGQKLSAEDWKCVFTASLRKTRVVPGIDAGTYVPLGMQTSRMTKDEMTMLLDLIDAFAAERGVTFSEAA